MPLLTMSAILDSLTRTSVDSALGRLGPFCITAKLVSVYRYSYFCTVVCFHRTIKLLDNLVISGDLPSSNQIIVIKLNAPRSPESDIDFVCDFVYTSPPPATPPPPLPPPPPPPPPRHHSPPPPPFASDINKQQPYNILFCIGCNRVCSENYITIIRPKLLVQPKCRTPNDTFPLDKLALTFQCSQFGASPMNWLT